MNPLDSFWNGVLFLLTPIVTPDWGQLVALIPVLLALLVLAFLALLGRAWFRMALAQPLRGPKARRRTVRLMAASHLAVIVIGIATVVLAFVAGAQTQWSGRTSPAGLFVSLPLLILGIGLVVGATGSAARLWERSGRDDVQPDAIDGLTAAIRRHPDRAKRATVFLAGVLIAATGMALGAVPGFSASKAASGDWPTDISPSPVPVAVIPVLLLGLALAVGAVGSAMAALWRDRGTYDEAEGGEGTSLVIAEH